MALAGIDVVRTLLLRAGGNVTALAGGPARPRWVAIDALKGVAILSVLLIHSKALGDGPGFLHVVNRAVPLFVIIFGLNSSLWWRHRQLLPDLALWYSTRTKRILVPFWASLPVWWALALWYRPSDVVFHWWLPLVQLGGYTLHIGTGWFVTMILLLAVIYPGVGASARRWGIWPVFLVAVVGELLVVHWRIGIVERFGFLNFLAFPPRVLAHVVFGMLLATRIDRLGPAAGAAAAAVWVVCVLVQRLLLEPGLNVYLDGMIDFPLAVALLVGLRTLAGVPVIGSALVWLGVRSWGLYLGQMLVHCAIVYQCGFLSDLAPDLAACHFPFATDADAGNIDRWLYTLVLLVGAIAFLWLGEQLLLAYGALRRSGMPLPDLLR